MQLARVKGHATSTVKHPSLAGVKLLLCETLGADGGTYGDPILVIDRLGAGRGDTIMVSSDGKGLREVLHHENTPARWWSQGIVDTVTGMP